jgi:hypothetical protein
MSADNGIYIGIFADGECRVAHAMAIDNCWDYKTGEEVPDFIHCLYHDAPSFKSLDEAWPEALRQLEEGYTEYGINVLHFQKTPAEYANIVATTDTAMVCDSDLYDYLEKDVEEAGHNFTEVDSDYDVFIDPEDETE